MELKPIASKGQKVTSYFLIAVLISLSLHASVLTTMWLWPALGGGNEEEQLTEMDLMELTEELEQKIPESMREVETEEIRNVESNMEAQRSSEAINYRSKERIASDVYNDVKNYEQQLLKELKENKAGIEQKPAEEKKYSNTKEMYEMKGKNESYGSAMVSYFLEGRESKVLPVPGYKCKAGGKVVISVEVDQQGKITGASIDEAKTDTANECLRAEALEYARKSGFFAKPSAPKKQLGTIVYLFLAQ